MRIYSERFGRFLSVDPITSTYPNLTPYQFASNTPIAAIDLDGLEAAGMYFPSGISTKKRDAAIRAANQSNSGFINGFVGSACNTVKSLALLTSTIPTFESIQAKAAMVHAITHPKETLKNVKAGLSNWVNALKSSDPYTRSHALGQGLEFLAETALPVKGVGAVKSLERIKVASSFYEKAEFASAKALEHMEGINFSKGVKQTILKEGTVFNSGLEKTV